MATCKYGYSRRTHLIGLLSAPITYCVMTQALIINKDKLDNRYCIAGSLLLVTLTTACYYVLWWLRGFHKWFPLFHLITLNIEFVYHCVVLVTLTYVITIFVELLLEGFNIWLLVATVAVALVVFAHGVLVYVTLAVPYVLLTGSVAQAELAELAEQVSGAAVILPGDTATLSQA